MNNPQDICANCGHDKLSHDGNWCIALVNNDKYPDKPYRCPCQQFQPSTQQRKEGDDLCWCEYRGVTVLKDDTCDKRQEPPWIKYPTPHSFKCKSCGLQNKGGDKKCAIQNPALVSDVSRPVPELASKATEVTNVAQDLEHSFKPADSQVSAGGCSNVSSSVLPKVSDLQIESFRNLYQLGFVALDLLRPIVEQRAILQQSNAQLQQDLAAARAKIEDLTIKARHGLSYIRKYDEAKAEVERLSDILEKSKRLLLQASPLSDEADTIAQVLDLIIPPKK